MSPLDIPNVVTTSLQTIRYQTDIIAALSSGGVGIVIFILARIFGIFDDANLSGFKKKFVPIISLICLVISVILGYWVGNLIVGYHLEIVKGISASTGVPIPDARNHFIEEYQPLLRYMAVYQLSTSCIGLITFVIWFVWNLSKTR